MDAPARQLDVSCCQRLPGTSIHRRNRFVDRARRSVGVLPAEEPPRYTPIEFEPATMLWAAQHQRQFPCKQYGLIRLIVQAKWAGAVDRPAGHPGTPAGDRSRLTAEFRQQYRELERIGFQASGIRSFRLSSSHGTQPAKLMHRSRSSSTLLRWENRQQRQWRCDIQIINLAVTEIVFQQIVQVHLVAGGDTIEP